MTTISTDSTVVTAEYEVNHRLIFRAHLSLYKWRFGIALLITASLIGSLIYFFLLIGEREILWQTSPLFIGVPLVGLFGQLLRLHATSRKYVSSLLPSQRGVRYAFRTDAGAYEVLFGDSYSLIAWADHLKALEKSGYFLLFHNRYDASIIPKSAFEPNGISVFRRILKLQLGDRAHVEHS